MQISWQILLNTRQKREEILFFSVHTPVSVLCAKFPLKWMNLLVGDLTLFFLGKFFFIIQLNMQISFFFRFIHILLIAIQ